MHPLVSQRVVAVSILLALILSACGGDGTDTVNPPQNAPAAEADDTAAAAPTATSGADSPSDAEPDTGSDGGMPDEGTSDRTGEGTSVQVDDPSLADRWQGVAPRDCAPPSVLPDLAPADPSALPLPGQGAGVEPGRYTNDRMGVSFAIDLPPDRFDDTGQWAATVGFFGDFGQNNLLFQRMPFDGFILDYLLPEEYAEGLTAELVSLDTWLTKDTITVLADTAITVGGYPARDLRIIIDDPTLDQFGDYAFTDQTSLQVAEIPQRLIQVDVDGGSESVMIQVDVPDDPSWAQAIDTMLDSITFGGVGPSFESLFADNPWDLGNTFSGVGPVLMDACTVSALAFGGVQFDLPTPAVVSGQGSELNVRLPTDDHIGFWEPGVHLVAPGVSLQGKLGQELVPGPAVESIEDALTELEADGYQLTAVESQATLLGVPVIAFEFTVEGVPFSWVARGNGLSNGLEFGSQDEDWEGTMYLAETDFGVIIASYGGGIGTGDRDLVEDLFHAIVNSLRPIE